MKAIFCKSFDENPQLSLVETDQPTPAPDEVLIRTAYCGVNFPDTLIIRGKYQHRPDLPFSPGQELAGEVAEVGAEITHVQVGDPVLASMTWGAFAEYAVAKGSNTYLIPPKVSPREASSILETYATALHALKDRGNMKPGETLLVLGASGGTGTAAVQLGRIFGSKVIAVASSPDKREFALENGAHEAFAPAGLKEAIKALGGADVVFDPVGGELAEEAFRTLRPGGRHLVVGFASGKIPALPFNLPLLKSASIVGVYWGGFWRTSPDENRRNVHLLLRWFSEKKLKVNITRTYPLFQAQKALEDLSGRSALGKIILEV